jgi:unsaturated rhamnogalacturonyl hydrolase
MKKKRLFQGCKVIVLLLITAITLGGCATLGRKTQVVPPENQWHVRMIDSEMHRRPEAWMLDFEHELKWNYTHGLVLMATLRVWELTGEQKYFDYVKNYYDAMLDAQGNILHNFNLANENIDHIKPGINLFDLYEHTGDERYLTAIRILREKLRTYPRTTEGGFWHKRVYPHQLWLDGVYMHAAFYARYGKVFGDTAAFNDVLHQITLVERVTRCEETGLLFHAWDETRRHLWADPITGRSPNFWGRAIGWYIMALVDALDYFPPDHRGVPIIRATLQRLVDALIPFQDSSGLWYLVVDQMNRPGNYHEASSTSMFAYAIAKGVNNGHLDPKYMQVAERAYQGLLDHLVSIDENGHIHLNQIIGVAGLGGNPAPYRDGSFEYYISEPIRPNDPKGVGPFMLLSMEMERAGLQKARRPWEIEMKRSGLPNTRRP